MADARKNKKAVPPQIRKPDNFDELEKEFECVLGELLNDERLECFKVQYEKLHAALVNSHQSERLLLDKVQELNKEIATNAEKVATALRLSKEDENRICNLTGELEAAWKKVEYLKQKEMTSNEMIISLHQEIDTLNKLVQRGADLAQQFHTAEPSGYKPLTQSISSPGEPADRDEEDMMEMDKVDALRKRVQELTAENSKLMEIVSCHTDEMREKVRELQREKRHIGNLQLESQKLAAALEAVTDEKNQAKRQQELLMEKLDRCTSEHLEMKIKYDLCAKDVDILNNRLQKCQADMEKQSTMMEALQMEIIDQNDKIQIRDAKMAKLNDTVKKLTKTKEIHDRKVKMLNDQRSALGKEQDMLKGQLVNTLKIIEQNTKLKEADHKHITGLMHEKELLNKHFVKQVKATERQTNMVNLHEQTTINMGHEIMGFRREAEKQRRIIVKLEMERDRYINENGDLTVKMMKCMEECQMRDLCILDLKKQGEELESRLKIQQNIFEVMHQDRNMYSRQLIETQDEMKEMRSKLRMLEHQSHQLKEEVAAREAAVVKGHLEGMRLEKERDGLQAEIQMLRQHLHDVQQVITDLRAEEKNLQKVIVSSDEMINRQKRELDTVIRERDILGSQLVRRNDELSLLYQKVHLLDSLINNGNRMYDERLEDIRLLRLEVKRQRHENRCLQKSVSKVIGYKLELYSVHREVLHERARRAALENELSQPRQIHRWRGLEITDPSKFDILQKVQALQKRLIARTEEVVELERVLKEKDRLYLELRGLLERQPGPEVTNQISAYQRMLKTKNRQLKSLIAEHNMSETEKKLDEYDVQKLQMEVVDLKKKYFREKKRRKELQEHKIAQDIQVTEVTTKLLKQSQTGMLPSSFKYIPEKIAGGGFRMVRF